MAYWQKVNSMLIHCWNHLTHQDSQYLKQTWAIFFVTRICQKELIWTFGFETGKLNIREFLAEERFLLHGSKILFTISFLRKIVTTLILSRKPLSNMIQMNGTDLWIPRIWVWKLYSSIILIVPIAHAMHIKVSCEICIFIWNISSMTYIQVLYTSVKTWKWSHFYIYNWAMCNFVVYSVRTAEHREVITRRSNGHYDKHWFRDKKMSSINIRFMNNIFFCDQYILNLG
jgi:hypothetical protein